ncbi:MAG TPA: hypothetical protein VFO60_04435 [Candidatus Dormibacteraeota bacterium]|nr:hypothetical protein [Candidatus Dormibacteraeota bacterium]
MADDETTRDGRPAEPAAAAFDDLIGDDRPDVEVEEEDVAPEVATSFATKGLGWSGREHRKM